jgi:hypothetical protein
MTSAINPNNIDGTYPVAGQDNNSQGFRTNFTNTATNFQYAADEISDLQSKVVLKQALTGTTLDNNMLGSPLSNALLSNMSEATVTLGTVSGTTTINYALGSYQTLTTGGAVSLAFINFPAAGAAASVTVQVTVASASHTVTFPTSVSVNGFGIIGFNAATNVMSFAATGTYAFTFNTSNGGTTVTVNENNSLLRPYNASSDAITTTSSAINLGTTYSVYFPTPTSTAGTATLADGVAGQTKVIGSLGTGTFTVTVASPSWGGSGHINFNAAGQNITLVWSDPVNLWLVLNSHGAVTLS